MSEYYRYRCAINEVVTILLWLSGGLTAWWIFGYCWLKFFVGDETEEYEGYPYK
jgi:hypothetical protein